MAVKSKGPFAVHLRGLLVALPIFIVFLSLLMVRHVPVVTGYYYGAIFASLFALLVGMLMAGVSQVWPRARVVAAVAVLAIVGVQVANYWPLNEGWRVTHDEGLTRDRMAKAQANRDRRIPLQAEPHDLTTGEVEAIWLAWKQDRLERYLREQSGVGGGRLHGRRAARAGPRPPASPRPMNGVARWLERLEEARTTRGSRHWSACC